mgnify:CR=1 FL=1
MIKPLGFLVALAAFGLVSCGNQPKYTLGPDGKPIGPDGKPFNPYDPGTHEHFAAEPDYPKTMNVWRNEELLSRTNAENSRIVISLNRQRGMLMNGEEVALDYPVSTGRSSHPTPPGTYEILEKEKDKSSNAYGKIYDGEGKVVVYDADSRKDEVPEGGKFVGAPMPYWMRLSWDGVGHHIGPLPRSRRPVSHACIRGPRSVMPTVFGKVKLGTPVTVE